MDLFNIATLVILWQSANIPQVMAQCHLVKAGRSVAGNLVIFSGRFLEAWWRMQPSAWGTDLPPETLTGRPLAAWCPKPKVANPSLIAAVHDRQGTCPQ
jgi:hypothetical protein